LATLAPFADEQTVYPGHPLPPGAPSNYAVSFTVRMDAPGLIFLCRDSGARPDAHPFDAPFSTRFDEQDAYCIFDDVEVPKSNVWIDGQVDVYNTVMMPSSWWPNIMQQTTIRALTKLEFAYGLASNMAKAIGDYSDMTADMMGELLIYTEMTRSGLLLSIEHARDYGDGVWFPDERPLAPLRATLTQWIPRAFEILTLIGSHNLIAAPSRGMLNDHRLRSLIDRYMDGADDIDAEQRAAVFRLAWDFCGSALAGRHGLYERFYLGSAARNRKTMWMAAEGTMTGTPGPVKVRGDELVEAMLALGRS
jgi:aromatic ring hydroxylase